MASRGLSCIFHRLSSIPLIHSHSCASKTTQQSKPKEEKQKLKKAATPIGKLDDKIETSKEKLNPTVIVPQFPAFPDGVNPGTGEVGGPRGPEPTRYGDWERNGRVSDF